MIVIYAVLILFSFVITPFRLDIYEAVTMLVIFIGYTVFLILRTNRENQRKKKSGQISGEQRAESNAKPLWLSLLFAAVGLAGIIFGGNIVVDNAAAVAKALGMSETLVGLTIVAVGTSLPELVTSIVASIKKEDAIALGNVVGSNIFNIVFILGLSSAISPLTFDRTAITDMAVMFGSGLLVMIIALIGKKTTRIQGILMTFLYIAYFIYIIIRN